MKVIETKEANGMRFTLERIDCEANGLEWTIWQIRQIVIGREHQGYNTILHSGFGKGYIRKMWKLEKFFQN